MTEVRVGKMGRMKWEMIFWIAVTLFFIVNGQDVSFQYDDCYSSENGITMTAKYTGPGTVSGVQWYYSGKTGSNLLVTAATCTVFGSIPPGYPNASQMHFQCPSTNSSLEPNEFKLTVTGLEGEDLKNSWGAIFSLSAGSSPNLTESSFSVCATTVSVSDCECCLNCKIPLPGCIFLWILIGVGIACLISAVVILILRFVVGVRFPCGILNCENKKTSPKDSKTGKTKSTAGNTQPPKDEVNEDLVMEDKKETRVDFDKSSAGHTKKRPPAKLDQLNEPGSEKHHIGGRPLPEIGKYN